MIDQKIDQLLEEMAESRATLRSYVEDVSKLKDKVAQMFPNDLNFRNRFVLDEKVKTMTSFYSVLLNLQQEINKSNKDEIEIRRKLDNADDDSAANIDVRKLADLLEPKMKMDSFSFGEPEKPSEDVVDINPQLSA